MSMVDETTSEQWNGGGDVTLLQAIEDGTIPKPSRYTWQDWQKWRKKLTYLLSICTQTLSTQMI
jgi:hypothetical protein